MNKINYKQSLITEILLSGITIIFLVFSVWQIYANTSPRCLWRFLPLLLGIAIVFIGKKINISRVTLYFIGLCISVILMRNLSIDFIQNHPLISKMVLKLALFALPPLGLHTLLNFYYGASKTFSEKSKLFKILIYIPLGLLILSHINIIISMSVPTSKTNTIFFRLIDSLQNLQWKFYAIPYGLLSLILLGGLLLKLFTTYQNNVDESQKDDKKAKKLKGKELAHQLSDDGHYLEAIKIYEKEKDWASAASLYSKIGNYSSAADMYLKAKEYNNAGAMYIKNSEPKEGSYELLFLILTSTLIDSSLLKRRRLNQVCNL